MVFLIGAGPGDPGLMTLKGRECLETADIVFYDRLVSPDILQWVRPGVEQIYVGKEPNRPGTRQSDIIEQLLEHARAGRTVARLKGGDPFVFGRGGEEAEALAAHGLPFEIIPGVTSAVAVPAYAGIPLTHRGVTSGFHVVQGHESVDSPAVDWPALAKTRQTIVILMGLANLPDIVGQLLGAGMSADTPVAVVRWGTTNRQQSLLGTLGDIDGRVKRAQLHPPATIIIGEVVRLAKTLSWFGPTQTEAMQASDSIPTSSV